MKTYKFLLVALIATGFFTACNNEIAVEQSIKQGAEISFRLQGGMPEQITTRSMATTKDNLEAFVVFGTDDVLAATNDLIFEGVTVARQLDGDFAYFPKKYFSVGVTYAGFFAFAPVSAIDPLDIDMSTFTSGEVKYTVPAPDGSGDAVQEDLLLASEILALPTDFQNPVNLTFEHALARIFVTATNEGDEPVIIKALTLKNLKTSGKLVINSSLVWSWDPLFPSPVADYDYVLAPSGVAIPVGTTTKTLVTSMEQGMMVLPQETVNNGGDHTAGDFALEIVYDIANLTGEYAYVYIPLVSTAPNVGYEFEAGNQYNINITFDADITGNPIEFKVIDVAPFGSPIDVNP